MKEHTWISVKDQLPFQTGWYNVKTKSGMELPIAYSSTLSGGNVWVIPDPSQITHWRYGK